MNLKWLLLLVLLTLLPGVTKPTPTVEDFYGQCASLRVEDRAFCIGFLLGYIKAQTIPLVYEDGTPVAKDLICLREAITSDQLRRVFIDWAENNADRAKDERWVGVLSALSDALPCE